MSRKFAACVAIYMMSSFLPATPANATQEIRYRFCNSDASIKVALTYASYNLSYHTTKVSGWYVVDPGRCRDVWIWSGESYTHHFAFSSGGKLVNFGPKEYQILGFRGTGSLRPSGKSYCIDQTNRFDYTETIFSLGRATSCRTGETLTPFAVSTYGCERCEINFDIPALSGKEAPPGSLLKQLFKWF